MEIDPQSGYCKTNGVFYSKRKPAAIPDQDDPLDVPNFVLSRHEQGNQMAFVDAITGLHVTYSHLRRSAMAAAAGLHQLGVQHGDIILIVSPNFLQFPALAMGIMSIGAVLSTANPLYTSSELQKQIEDSMPVLVFTTPQLLNKFNKMNVRIVMIGTPEESRKYNAPVISSLSSLLSSDPANKPPTKIRQDSTAVVLYSSGTTGRSKGVVSTHRNLIVTTSILCTLMGSCKDVYLCFIPLFHMYGFNTFVCGLMAIGATVVILPKFTMEGMLMAIQRYRVTHIPAVPAIAIRLSKLPNVDQKYDLSSLKEVMIGGASMGREQMEAFRSRFPGIGISQIYGMTELSGSVIKSEGNDIKHYGSVGILVPNVEAKVVDIVTGKPLPPNARGELCFRGPMVMKEYYKNKEATSSSIDSEGWLHSGDICRINEEGHVYIVDRLKELIKYKGLQIAPAELEELLLCNPEIEDSAVIPYPDEEAGEVPMAFIAKKPTSNLTAEDVIEFVGRQVAPYKKIRRVAFVVSIPRTESGKILRKHLRALVEPKTSTPSRL